MALAMIKIIQLLILVMCPSVGYSLDVEPLCSSRYDFDYKMLKEVINLEQKIDELTKMMTEQKSEMTEQMTKLKKEIHKEQLKIREMEISTIHTNDVLDQLRKENAVKGGSVYVRWGRTTCPGNSTDPVYNGYAGGSDYNDNGAAVNPVCLPLEPEWGEFDESILTGSKMYGAQYMAEGSHSKMLYGDVLIKEYVPCVLCHSTRPSVVMIPARTSCYEGWTHEYTGYLNSGRYHENAASEYVCLDESPEIIRGADAKFKASKRFYTTSIKCNALKCPPYVHNREVACVVCSK